MTIPELVLGLSIAAAAGVWLILGGSLILLNARLRRPPPKLSLATGLTAEQADMVRILAARATADGLKDVFGRFGSTPETVGLAAEGVIAAVASLAWNNRSDRRMRPGALASSLARIAREQVETVSRGNELR